MKIIETRQKNYTVSQITEVMVEGQVDDVAVYQAHGHVSGDEAFRDGVKMTERDATARGWTIPEGKHYRR